MWSTTISWLSAMSGVLGYETGLDQAGLVGEDDGLDPVPQSQLGQDPGHVGLDRGLAERQRGRQLGVAQAAPDQAEHLQFTWRQRGQIRAVTSGIRRGEP